MKGLRRKTALIMAFLFVLAALTACGQKGRLRIGTAGEGGNYNSLGKALSQTLQKDPYKINVEVKTTAGSAANIRLLSQAVSPSLSMFPYRVCKIEWSCTWES